MTHSRSFLAAALIAVFAGGAMAQTAARSVQAVPPRAGSNMAAPSGTVSTQGSPAVAAGTPSASGLQSPTPYPQGLPSVQPYPQGVPSSVIVPPGTAAPGTGIIPGTAPSAVADPAATAPATAVGSAGTPAAPQSVPAGPSGYTALQLAQAFRAADANLNGELTRAEAARLSIMPLSFEEMDTNKDGVLSKSEFEDGVK